MAGIFNINKIPGVPLGIFLFIPALLRRAKKKEKKYTYAKGVKRK